MTERVNLSAFLPGSMRISAGSSAAEVDARGAYLRSLVLGGQEILLKEEDGRQTHGGACNLIPYAGRIRGGTYSSGGERYSFPKGKDGNSIHGFAREHDFTCIAESDGKATFRADLSDTGYPSRLEVSIRYGLDERRLTVSYHAENKGSRDAPLVIGSHPYFLIHGGWGLTTSSPARELALKDRYFPDGSMRDFRFDRDLTGMHLDSCFTGGGELTLDTGRGRLVIRRKGMEYFLVYNGEYTRGESVAVEPMTGAPDAYNNGLGLTVLRPGSSFECSYSVETA